MNFINSRFYKETKNILFVSIAFPPKSDPESIQVGRYLKNLTKSSYEINCITSSNPTLFMEVDPYLDHYAEGIKTKHELRIFEN